MTSLDDAARIRALNDAITKLEPPALSHDTFAQITARRATGERIALPTSKSFQSWWIRKPILLAASLVGVAAAILLASLVQGYRRDVPETAAPELMALSPVDAACASFVKQDSSLLRHLMVSAFGVAAACGAEVEPSVPLTVDPGTLAPTQRSIRFM